MENLKKVTERTDYQYILSLTFIEKEKESAKMSEHNLKKQFQDGMKAEEIIQKSTGLKPSDSQFGPIQEVLEISEAIKEN